MTKQYFSFNTSIGPICIVATEKGICSLHLKTAQLCGVEKKSSTLINLAANQIMEYLAGKRRYFDIPLNITGTEFQTSVWNALQNIPYASTLTCKEIASTLGQENSFRQVGSAIAANPCPIIIPDHRIVESTGNAFGNGTDKNRRAAFLSFEKNHT